MSTPANRLTGTRLGPYEILERIGAGGMGEVYRAHDTRLGRDVAVKFLPERVTADPARLARFQREARLLAALNHPNVAAIYGVEDQPVPCLVLELVPGDTLAERIARGPVPLAPALTIARQIADALDAAHEKGIVHRDLKPSNIKLTPDGVVKVLDFGLAKAADPAPATTIETTDASTLTGLQTREGVVMGTPAYMSPEQARGLAVDRRTDVWAFGCVLYEMLTGRAAFAGATTTDVLAAVVGREPDLAALPVSTPPVVLRLLQRCLEKDIRQRLRDIGDARYELEEASAPASAASVQPPAAGESSRRNTGARVVAAGAVVVIGALAIAAALLLRRAPQGGATFDGTARIEQLTFDSGLTSMPAVSPDGRLLAYASNRAGRGDLDVWVQQLNGGAPLRLTDSPSDDYAPAFSPDSSQIVFRSERDGGGLYIVPALGGDARRIMADGRSPRFSPDGKRIAYWTGPWRGLASGPATSSFVLPLDGGQAVQLLADFTVAREPVWAPDGSGLMVLARPASAPASDESFDFYFVPLDGRPVVRSGILDEPGFRDQIDRSPISSGRVGTWSGSGLLVFFEGRIVSVPVDVRKGTIAGRPRLMTLGTGQYIDAAAAPDGSVVFADARTSRSMQRAAIGSQDDPARLYEDDQPSGTRPGLTPDGTQLLYDRAMPTYSELVLRNLRAGTERLVARVDASSGRLANPVVSDDGLRAGYTLSTGGQESGFVVNTTGGLPNQVCSACGVWGFLSGGRRIVVVTSDGQADVVDVATREREPVLRVKGGRVDRVHVSPDERLVSFRSSNRLLVAPFTPGHPPPETSFAPIDDPAATGRPCGWSRDSSSVFLLLDTDGFRCLWSQRIDAATAKPTGAPVAARHFHQTIVQEFSTTFGNAITDEGFVYGATLLKANLWRLVPDASAASRR